jgi:hypothetical protein
MVTILSGKILRLLRKMRKFSLNNFECDAIVKSSVHLKYVRNWFEIDGYILEVRYLQNLKGSAISNTIWYWSCQVVVAHITVEINHNTPFKTDL